MAALKKRGRPKGSKNKPKATSKRGRPKGSKSRSRKSGTYIVQGSVKKI